MFVKKLILKNYRNYEDLVFEPERETNLIYGKNGQGKTNIVEAINFFASLRSHRVSKHRDLIKYDEEFASLTLIFENNEREFEAKITLLPDERRKMELNGSKIVKNSELIGLFNAVMFSPEDFLIIKEGPSERRRYIDIAISQVKPNYFNTLVEYNKVLKMKNKILKEEGNYSELIDVYNEKLASLGGDIIFYRNKYIEFIKTLTDKLHREITLSLDKFEIKYESCIPVSDRRSMQKEYLKKLNKIKSKEIFERTSLFGIQREDIGFFINGNRVREFASQGQQRTVILILRLTQAEYIKEIKGEYPVLLLDDILSELDSERRKYLLNEIRNKQVIITSTDKGSFARRKNTKLIHIDNAKIINWQLCCHEFSLVAQWIEPMAHELQTSLHYCQKSQSDFIKSNAKHLFLNEPERFNSWRSQFMKFISIHARRAIHQRYISIKERNGTLKWQLNIITVMTYKSLRVLRRLEKDRVCILAQPQQEDFLILFTK